jgi:hypothetical protein
MCGRPNSKEKVDKTQFTDTPQQAGSLARRVVALEAHAEYFQFCAARHRASSWENRMDVRAAWERNGERAKPKE